MRIREFVMPLVLVAACSQQSTVTVEQVQERYEQGTQAYESALEAFEQTAPRGAAYEGDLAPLVDFLRAVMRQRGDSEASERAAAYLATMPNYLTPLSADDYLEISAALPPASAHWTAGRNVIGNISTGLNADGARTKLESIVAENPDRSAQAQAVVALAQLERREGRMDAFAANYERATAYADVEGMGFPIRLLNPENNVVVGGQIPSFALPEIGGDQVITAESLRGRYYLLDFWATWCPPCIVERPALARMQARFGGERFTIVSVSVDNTQDVVTQFRERRWSMDWPNVFLGGQYDGDNMNFDTPVARAFDINWIGVPQLILVSPEGKVLALRDQLEGAMLERTLAQYLGPTR